jgi:hypothetical protein
MPINKINSGGGSTGLGSIFNMIQNIGGGKRGNDSIGNDASSLVNATQPSNPVSGNDSSDFLNKEGQYDPMKSAVDNHPVTQANNALQQLWKPASEGGLDLDYDTRMAVVEPLLRAVHLGPGGGLTNRNQGEGIAPANGDKSASGAMGAIGAIAAL